MEKSRSLTAGLQLLPSFGSGLGCGQSPGFEPRGVLFFARPSAQRTRLQLLPSFCLDLGCDQGPQRPVARSARRRSQQGQLARAPHPGRIGRQHSTAFAGAVSRASQREPRTPGESGSSNLPSTALAGAAVKASRCGPRTLGESGSTLRSLHSPPTQSKSRSAQNPAPRENLAEPRPSPHNARGQAQSGSFAALVGRNGAIEPRTALTPTCPLENSTPRQNLSMCHCSCPENSTPRQNLSMYHNSRRKGSAIFCTGSARLCGRASAWNSIMPPILPRCGVFERANEC